MFLLKKLEIMIQSMQMNGFDSGRSLKLGAARWKKASQSTDTKVR